MKRLMIAVVGLVLVMMVAGTANAASWTFTNAADYYVDGDWWTNGGAYAPVITALPGGGSAFVPARPYIDSYDDPPMGSDWASVFAKVNTQAPGLRVGDILGGGFTLSGMNHPDAVYGSLYLSPTGGSGSTVLILLSPMDRPGSGEDYIYTFDLDTHADYRTRTPPADWSSYDPAKSGTFGDIIGMLSASTDYAAFFGPQIGMSNTSGTTFTVSEIHLNTVPPVPEPITMIGVSMGIAGLGGYIRRRTRRAVA